MAFINVGRKYEYQKKDQLGEGGFGVVFKGRKVQDPKSLVAIKVISKQKLADQKIPLDYAKREIQISEKLHHNHIVALLDWYESSNNIYLVMEFCNGGDLHGYLKGKGDLDETTIRNIVLHLAEAIEAMRAKNVIHRDLKPANILLNYDSYEKISFKIADFGLARFLKDDELASSICGTRKYMAPELLMWPWKCGPEADLWSLGVILRDDLLKGKVNTRSRALQDLLIGLLQANPGSRISFDCFFKHTFLRPSTDAPLEYYWSIEAKALFGTGLVTLGLIGGGALVKAYGICVVAAASGAVGVGFVGIVLLMKCVSNKKLRMHNGCS